MVRVTKREGRNVLPSGVSKVRPSVVVAIGTFGRSGASWRRRVDRTRRGWSDGVRTMAGMSGSSDRCQPSRAWSMRIARLRSAQGRQAWARVVPQRIPIAFVWPVWLSVRRTISGRTHTPFFSAAAVTRSRSTPGAGVTPAVVMVRSPLAAGVGGAGGTSG